MKTSNESPVFEGKRLTPRAAIRAYLRSVNNGESPKTSSIGVFGMYDFNFSRVDGAELTPLKGIRERCLECAQSAEGVRTCAAYKPFLDHTPCALWPHRFGKRYVTEEYREARRAQANKQHREPGAGGAFKTLDEAEE